MMVKKETLIKLLSTSWKHSRWC